MMKISDKGFTLLEMILTVVVVAALAVVAVPSFNTMIDRNIVKSQATELLSSIALTRSEAIRRESIVIIRRQGTWAARWYIYNDINNNNSYSGPNGVDGPRIFDNIQTNNRATITGSGNMGTSIRYNSRGLANLTPTTDFLTVSKDGISSNICFSAIGLAYIQQSTCL